MKTKKKYVSLFLSILLVVNIFVPSQEAAGQEITAENMLFFDDFSEYNQSTAALNKTKMQENGWAVPNGMEEYVDGSMYTIPNTVSTSYIAVSNIENGASWTDYTVEADVCFDNGETTDDRLAAIVARATARNKTGYEFAAFIDETGASGVRISIREDADKNVKTDTLKTDTTIKIERNTIYNLKMTVHGSDIDCYVDNRLVFSVSDNSYTAGYIGLRTLGKGSGVAVSFDNLCAYRYDSQSVENDEISTFIEDFSAYEGAVAEKVQLFNKKGWGDINKTKASYAQDGSYQIPADASNVVYGLNNYPGAALWKDYAVEADVTIGTETVSKNVYLAISGRIDSDYSGYEFSIYKLPAGGTGVRLYRRGTEAKELDSKEVRLNTDTSNKLKMEFVGNQITCYLNGTQVIQETDDTYTSGYVGIRAQVAGAGVQTSYDNISVTGVGIARKEHAITALTTNTGGSISYEGNQIFSEGDHVTYTITPKYGYTIYNVEVDGVSVGNVGEYEFKDISSDHTISATFRRKRGDLNKDGFCDGNDVSLLQDILLGTEESSYFSNVNAKGTTDIVDLIRMNKKLMRIYGPVNEQDWTIATTGKRNEAEYQGGSFETDYQFSAYVDFDEDTLSSDSYISLIVDKEDSTYYEYRLYNNASELSAALYQCKNGSERLLASASFKYIQSLLSTKTCDSQSKMTTVCFENRIYCFLDDYMIMSYGDGSQELFQRGTVGYAINNATGFVTHVELTERISKCIMDMDIVGVDGNVLNFYEGYDLNPKDYLVRCTDVDGTSLFLPMSEIEVSKFDCEKAGKQSLHVSMADYSGRVTVNVNQRRTYIDYLEQKLTNCKISSLTEEDIKTIDTLLSYYDDLSYYEKALLTEETVDKVALLKEKREILCYGESELIYREEFDMTLASLWDGGYERPNGKWNVKNGAYQIQQIPYGLSTNCWRTASDFYGEIRSVEADVKLESKQMAAGIAFNISEYGYYYVCVNTTGSVPVLRLHKKNISVENLKSEYIIPYGIDIEDEWVKMRVEYDASVIRVWLNDVLVLTYDDSSAVEQYDYGYAGVCSISGDASFDNFVIRGTALKQTEAGNVTATTYTDDFEDETVNKSPSHWLESNKGDWVVCRNSGTGALFYGNSKKNYETSTWLHVFESNPTVTFKMRYNNYTSGTPDGVFGFFIRQSPDTAYVKVGFDVAASKWFVTETKGEKDCQINTSISEKYTFTENKWTTIKLTASGDRVELWVGDNLVYSVDNVSQQGVGRIGFFADGVYLRIDDVTCEFPSGAIVQEGVMEQDILPEVYAANLELSSTADGKLVGAGNSIVVLSEDDGATFKNVSSDSTYKALSGNGAYQSMVRLHDGNYLQIKSSDFSVYQSTDGINGWNKIGSVLSEFKDANNRRTKTFHVNSIVECQLSNGNYRIFLPVATRVFESATSTTVSGHYTAVYYSDDGGRTWSLSETDTRDILLDYEKNISTSSWAESKIIKCTDGKLRMYYSRNKLGCMQYTVSEDGGKTWSGQYPVPELQCPQSSFSLTQDSATGLYYLVWVNNAPYNYNAGFPRSRLSLATSEDGIHWKFLADVEHMSKDTFSDDVSVLNPLFQIIDPSIEVTEDYVFVTFGMSDSTLEQDNGTHNAQHIRMVRFEKDKLTVQEWNARNLANMSFTKEIALQTLPKQTFNRGEEFTYHGGSILMTALGGTTRTVDTARFYIYKMPDMTTAGKKTIVLYDRNGFSVTYTITVK